MKYKRWNSLYVKKIDKISFLNFLKAHNKKKHLREVKFDELLWKFSLKDLRKFFPSLFPLRGCEKFPLEEEKERRKSRKSRISVAFVAFSIFFLFPLSSCEKIFPTMLRSNTFGFHLARRQPKHNFYDEAMVGGCRVVRTRLRMASAVERFFHIEGTKF